MKNFIYFICIALLASSCASTKSSSAVRHPQKTSSSGPAFLENITIKPSGPPNSSVNRPVNIKGNTDIPGSAYSTEIEKCNALQFKYAILMEDEVEDVTNKKLISFLEDWYGIPYRYGGGTKSGIDCSAFSCAMMDSVYNVNIPRTCREQYVAGKKIRKDQLTQGDLVFFNTSGGVSHVGVYLGNNKFVHASTSSGVMISDLDDSYFKRRYVGSTRLR
ncbi:MAG: C40 family peptidase [Chitinophagaceae bacterium]|nr:C40 family peptidase [Chitinophagaceae bacterium]